MTLGSCVFNLSHPSGCCAVFSTLLVCDCMSGSIPNAEREGNGHYSNVNRIFLRQCGAGPVLEAGFTFTDQCSQCK